MVDTLHFRKKFNTWHLIPEERWGNAVGDPPSSLLCRALMKTVLFSGCHGALSFSLWNIVPQSPLLRAEDNPPLAEPNASGQSEALRRSSPTSCKQHPSHSSSCSVLLKSIMPYIWATTKRKIQSFLNRANFHSRSIQETRWSCNRLHIIGNSWVKKITYYGKSCTARQTCLNPNSTFQPELYYGF